MMNNKFFDKIDTMPRVTNEQDRADLAIVMRENAKKALSEEITAEDQKTLNAWENR